MSTIWKPDTCDCIIDLDKKEFIRRCRAHENVDGVLEHNRYFNGMDKPREGLMNLKAAEKKRIKEL